jgi:hypothetical protein
MQQLVDRQAQKLVVSWISIIFFLSYYFKKFADFFQETYNT